MKDAFAEMRSDQVAWIIDKYITMVLPIHDVQPDEIHVLEAFSGGDRGWKHAINFLGDHFALPMICVG